jgi:hypothetical protein
MQFLVEYVARLKCLQGSAVKNYNLWLWGFENFARVARVLAAVPAAASVPGSPSFGEVNRIIEAPPVTAGPPAAVIEAIVIFENIIFSQLLHSPA